MQYFYNTLAQAFLLHNRVRYQGLMGDMSFLQSSTFLYVLVIREEQHASITAGTGVKYINADLIKASFGGL